MNIKSIIVSFLFVITCHHVSLASDDSSSVEPCKICRDHLLEFIETCKDELLNKDFSGKYEDKAMIAYYGLATLKEELQKQPIETACTPENMPGDFAQLLDETRQIFIDNCKDFSLPRTNVDFIDFSLINVKVLVGKVSDYFNLCEYSVPDSIQNIYKILPEDL